MELPDWPPELPSPAQEELPLFSAASNICLDFHGDPLQADLVIFSDGNHHMALQECVQRFHARQPGCRIFYTTTPPGPILTLLRQGSLRVGNLVLSVRPHLFLGPPHVLDSLESDGIIGRRSPFMQNRGAALLVRRDNPKTRDLDLPALARPGLRLFLSNPDTESVSFQGYRDTLLALGTAAGLDPAFLETKKAAGEIVYGRSIHHREAPQAVAEGRADVAILYHHLALRFCRIFPEVFAMIPLPGPGNRIGHIHAGLVGNGGPWGGPFLAFLASDEVTGIYRHHGLDRPEQFSSRPSADDRHA